MILDRFRSSRARRRDANRPPIADAALLIASADALRDQGRFAEAATAYRHVVDALPNRLDLQVQLGNMLKDSGALEEAIRIYELVAGAEPGNADVRLQMGRACILAGQVEKAIAALKAALAIDPTLHAADEALARFAVFDQHINSSLCSLVSEREGPYIEGFAFLQTDPSNPIFLDIELDGVPYLRTQAEYDRGDLRQGIPTLIGGGFSFCLPPGDREVEVSIQHAGMHLRASPFSTRLRPLYGATRAVFSLPRVNASVVVPVYGAPQATEACLKALLAYTPCYVRLIVIDDASPGTVCDDIFAMCEAQAAESGHRLEVIRNTVNRGYTATVNCGIIHAGRDDVILLNSDAVVGPGWFGALRAAAASGSDIASVTPLSDNAGAFTAPDPETVYGVPDGLTLPGYQRWVRRTSAGHWPETPTGSGFCIYIRRAAIDVVGAFDEQAFPRGYGEENDWCLRALQAGFRHLIDDRTLVAHVRSASFGSEKDKLLTAARITLDARYPHYPALVKHLQKDPRLADARRRVHALHLTPPSGPVLPRALFVVSTQTGGTPLTNYDLMVAVSHKVEPWLLRCDSRQITLSRIGLRGTEEVDRHVLSSPLQLTPHCSTEYEAVVGEWLLRHGFEIIHIRHLAWHSLNLPQIAAAVDVPVVLSFHDFYMVCPTVKLLDESLTFCGGRCTTSADGDCTPDLWRTSAPPPLKHRFVHIWQRQIANVLPNVSAFVTTHAHAHGLLQSIYPHLQTARFEIIPHGRDFTQFVPPRSALTQSSVLNILAPGNIARAKGRDLIAAVAERDAGKRLRFHLLGDFNPPLEAPGVVSYGPYQRESFAARAVATSAEIGVVLSLWPETWCHTLTEMWAAGLPVAVLDFGAQADRVRSTGAGWVIPSTDAIQIADFLCKLADDPAERARAGDAVRRWQATEGRQQTIAAMSESYLKLYRAIAPAAFQ